MHQALHWWKYYKSSGNYSYTSQAILLLKSGASQSGFGRTGTVNWDTTVKTSYSLQLVVMDILQIQQVLLLQ